MKQIVFRRKSPKHVSLNTVENPSITRYSKNLNVSDGQKKFHLLPSVKYNKNIDYLTVSKIRYKGSEDSVKKPNFNPEYYKSLRNTRENSFKKIEKKVGKIKEELKIAELIFNKTTPKESQICNLLREAFKISHSALSKCLGNSSLFPTVTQKVFEVDPFLYDSFVQKRESLLQANQQLKSQNREIREKISILRKATKKITSE